MFFTFFYCISVFKKKSQSKPNNPFTGQANLVLFCPFSLDADILQERLVWLALLCIFPLWLSLLTPTAVVRSRVLWYVYSHEQGCSENSSEATWPVLRCSPWSELGLCQDSLYLLFMPFSVWGCLKKNNIYIFTDFVPSCKAVTLIFFTLGNFRSWGACVHANSWTEEKEKKKQTKETFENHLEKKCTKNGCRHFN